jgi:hypothetical protein
MSFLYLYKTEKDSLDSLYLMQDLLTFTKPKFMGMVMTEEDFKRKYAAYIKSNEFKTDMKKLDFMILTKKGDEIAKFKGSCSILTERRPHHRRHSQSICLQLVPWEEVQPGLRRDFG